MLLNNGIRCDQESLPRDRLVSDFHVMRFYTLELFNCSEFVYYATTSLYLNFWGINEVS